MRWFKSTRGGYKTKTRQNRLEFTWKKVQHDSHSNLKQMDIQTRWKSSNVFPNQISARVFLYLVTGCRTNFVGTLPLLPSWHSFCCWPSVLHFRLGNNQKLTFIWRWTGSRGFLFVCISSKIHRTIVARAHVVDWVGTKWRLNTHDPKTKTLKIASTSL